jgi:hypothetical protein
LGENIFKIKPAADRVCGVSGCWICPVIVVVKSEGLLIYGATMNQFDELLRRVEITCKARYHASSRLKTQNLFSQWTLSLLAVGQIVIGLITAINLQQNFSVGYTTFGSIFFSVLVLTYSLLLGMGDYSARAVKLHECGVALGRLARTLYPHKAPSLSGTQVLYEGFTKQYYDILEKHENHTKSDYLQAHYEYYSGQGMQLPVGTGRASCRWLKLQEAKVKRILWLSLSYTHYLITVALIWGWIYRLVC